MFELRKLEVLSTTKSSTSPIQMIIQLGLKSNILRQKLLDGKVFFSLFFFISNFFLKFMFYYFSGKKEEITSVPVPEDQKRIANWEWNVMVNPQKVSFSFSFLFLGSPLLNNKLSRFLQTGNEFVGMETKTPQFCSRN